MRADRRVAPRPAAPRLPVRAERARVHEPEARRRQRHEHRRVLGDRVRDALAAAQAGGDQVVGVLAVALRARRADGLAAVPARLAQHAVRLGVGRPHAPVAVPVAGLDRARAAGPAARSSRTSAAAPQARGKSGRPARSASSREQLGRDRARREPARAVMRPADPAQDGRAGAPTAAAGLRAATRRR